MTPAPTPTPKFASPQSEPATSEPSNFEPASPRTLPARLEERDVELQAEKVAYGTLQKRYIALVRAKQELEQAMFDSSGSDEENEEEADDEAASKRRRIKPVRVEPLEVLHAEQPASPTSPTLDPKASALECQPTRIALHKPDTPPPSLVSPPNADITAHHTNVDPFITPPQRARFRPPPPPFMIELALRVATYSLRPPSEPEERARTPADRRKRRIIKDTLKLKEEKTRIRDALRRSKFQRPKYSPRLPALGER
ncbi:hypothetical protein CC85DRAFT_299238 [Cutaneotrichosporon oleaginosum]|uniref:Uncharacterized protein n=1 Tax=Cutaneotrichosporon oleaginosum TaxID=879819 RepID=A0A0J0XX07_9TREE|nr:uncharacterized protein CC85DRAFT_299238 [Cutaneotrichosporon oleaginosum]KLT45578.1 hypothetical protein CC85DRAFT_299238 [Cutaneotrichosporon oleaginosum]TXT04625.1 hypothetical protein COLE_07444 [Cutaneotrichosporon oleaginosum]